MIFDIVVVAYSVANVVLAALIFVKYRQVVLSKFYTFCVACLLCMGVIGYLLPDADAGTLRSILKPAGVFLYSVFPFFFIHFVVIFVRRYEILRSRVVVGAIYFTGLFSYTMILLGFIPEPILPNGHIAQSGRIFFVTWMTIFFSIGVAMMYEVARGFYEKVGRGNVLLGSFILLLLVLPGPFTETIFFNLLNVGSPGYYVASLIAVVVAVFFIFRQKIIVNTFYESLKRAVAVINDVIFTTNEKMEIEMVKGGVVSLLGYQEPELQGKQLADYLEPRERLEQYAAKVAGKERPGCMFDVDFRRKAGDPVPMNLSMAPMVVNDQLTGFVVVGRDFTERKKMEEHLREKDKLEGLGTLAAGVAHDFNNILQILLMNNTGRHARQDSPDARSRSDEMNRTAIDRGRKLVSQILTFARKTPVEFHPVVLNEVISENIRLLTNTFPKTVSFSTSLSPGLTPVNADEGQLSQIILNLAVNARDAMSEKGEISISTGVVHGADLIPFHPEAEGTDYVKLSLSDTGSGMDQATRKQIFEPFFTTKERGKGTGLGLAVVYGIITTHGGFIDVRSEPGKGTNFDIYLPVHGGPAEAAAAGKPVVQRVPKRGRTVLIVEDEEMILESTAALLHDAGYRCLVSRDGNDSLELWEKHREEIQTVLLDLDLPGMNGWEVFQKLKERDPSARIIICSGYFDPERKAALQSAFHTTFLSKPYDRESLLNVLASSV